MVVGRSVVVTLVVVGSLVVVSSLVVVGSLANVDVDLVEDCGDECPSNGLKPVKLLSPTSTVTMLPITLMTAAAFL